jgi:hypothetical protein
MTGIRNMAFVIAVLSSAPIGGIDRTLNAPRMSMESARTSRGLCVEPPLEEWCSYWEQFLQCTQWDTVCTMVEEYNTLAEAQEACDTFADSCGWAAEAALTQDECWWTCTIER